MKILNIANQAPDSLTERVYRQLRSAIITGKISGGTRLVESNLAAELKVSRTPIREALHKLALEGLLYSIPRAGYIVEEMSDHDIQDLFTIRMSIEQIAARLAIEKITPRELDRLKANLDATDAVLATGITAKMVDLDIEFHGIIYRAARSKTLFRICRGLSDHTLKYRIALIHLPEIGQKTRNGHYEIFKAIRSKDPVKADEAIRAHMQLAKQDIIALLEQLRHEDFLSRDAGI